MGKKARKMRSADLLDPKHDAQQNEQIAPEVDAMADSIVDKLAPTSLGDLQSQEYRQILDTVDRLRQCGLGAILPLPQLVVCGNQSSGKSSVLEAITEVPFPRKENLCTRFATEIILRRDKSESIRTKIIPDKSRQELEIKRLQEFTEVITDFSELPALIEKATEVMGLNENDDREDANRAFSRDVLSIEIAGPNRPQLTLVDLPGLIQSANKMQTEADVKLIHSLVGDYLAEKRTVMLAVISAKDDYANQAILTKCREVDKDGKRTLGIVTKPDYLRPGSANEQIWLNLAQNRDVYFELGWHILKNRSEDEMDASFEARNASEKAFLNSGSYKNLPEKDKGIATLRTKLSKLLFRHLKNELPNLKTELNNKHNETIKALEHLGEKRSTPDEQRRYLVNIAMNYQGVVNAAVDGHYRGDFFVSTKRDAGFDDPDNLRRFRAAVQYSNGQFASQMRQYGHKYRIMSTDEYEGTNAVDEASETHLSDAYAAAKSMQQHMEFDDAVEWVKNILLLTRGKELPGDFSPVLMSELFWEQSAHWEKLCLEHIDVVHGQCTTFVEIAIKSVAPEVATQLQSLRVTEALQTRRSNALKELRQLLNDKNRNPMTFNPEYAQAVREARARKHKARMDALIEDAKVSVFDKTRNDWVEYVNPSVLATKLETLREPDGDKSSAEDALNSQIAFYKDRVRTFIAAVTEQVIERHLLDNLGPSTLSPLIITDMSNEEVAYVAAESEDVTQKREYLENQKKILESGQAAFRQALGTYS